MQILSDEQLLECVMLAKQLELDPEFLTLLMSELRRRGIELQDDGVLLRERALVSDSYNMEAAQVFSA